MNNDWQDMLRQLTGDEVANNTNMAQFRDILNGMQRDNGWGDITDLFDEDEDETKGMTEDEKALYRMGL